MPIDKLLNSDVEYRQWLDAHRDGFVANTTRRRTPYFVVHKASCHHVNVYGHLVEGAFTERDYVKIGSENLEEIFSFGFENGYMPKVCKTCSPNLESNFQKKIMESAELDPVTRGKILKTAPKKPAMRWVITRAFDRNPHVVAERLYQANGTCEACGSKAPFNTRRGDPYLEVHHKKWLSEDGTDTVENTVALCPNCHRREHHGERRFDEGSRR